MKKRLCIITALVLIATLLAGCSSGRSDYNYKSDDTATESAVTDYKSDGYGYAVPVKEGNYELAEFSGTYDEQHSPDDKIIYTATAEVETIDFDQTVENVYDLIENYGAFLESSYISGKSYRAQVYDYQTYRYAEFVVRVPAAGYKSMTQNLSVLGNVLSVHSSTDNITEQFYDSKSRLDTYRVEEERLISMLSKAETVTDMLEIESRLSDVRYDIESLESRLRTWQKQVDYSTVTIQINEVQELTRVVEPQRSYWQQISDGFMESLRSVGRFFKDMFMWIASSLPELVLIAVIIFIAVLIIKKIFGKKARERRIIKRREKLDRKMAKKNGTDVSDKTE